MHNRRFFSWISVCLFSGCVCLLLLVTGCHRDGYTMKPVSASEKQLEKLAFPDTLVKKYEKGIEFFAAGSQPRAWSLAMDDEGLFTFESLNNNLALNATRPIAATAGKVYQLNDRSGTMTITIFTEACRNQAVKVTALVNGTQYSGCGNALYDPKLDGNWEIIKLNNKTVSAADFKNKIPFLSFDTKTNNLTGTDGCVGFSAAFAISGQKITVGSASRDKSNTCDQILLQGIFNKMIFGKLITYTISGSNLFLYLPDDSILEYKRK